MEKKRKTDLFRFVTLRSPELLSKEKKALGFVEHPDSGKSAVLAKKAKSPFAYVSEVKSLNDKLWKFSLWLENHKSNIEPSKISSLVPEINDLDGINLRAWEGLYSDIQSRSNPNIRQACLQLIVTINFIKKIKNYLHENSDDTEEYVASKKSLQRLANGKVIIDEKFAVDEAPTGSLPLISLTPKSSKQEIIHRAKLAGQDISDIETVQADIRNLCKSYNLDRAQALSKAHVKYEAQVDKIVAEYLRANPQGDQEKELEYIIPEDLVPNFEFDYSLPLSPEYTKGKVSDITAIFIASECLGGSTIEHALDRVNQKSSNIRRVESESSRKKYSSILINGVLVKPLSSASHNFTLSFIKSNGQRTKKMASSMTGMFSIETGYNGGFFTKGKFSLTIGKDKYKSDGSNISSNSNGGIFVQMFDDVNLPTNTLFTFEGEFELDNGKKLAFTKKGTTSSEYTNGVATVLPASSNNTELYGVNRVGIADYRRVEQDLCCYIAGEVSHIENILAKEYKEKATRNLTSTETTIESTTEREVEELTDTTSTNRHEMSTEIAEVLERDRESNLGFETGVDGKYPSGTYYADASGDFTFGQSTSDSNTIARNYAEDVTRRALERIVQKTTVKRSSKVLREFEENNKHGYDNRTGEDHVTGVFRWIDKIYKNRIVNYRKRLMYEFMIPEPARFYKEAIIIQAEEEEATGSIDGSTDTGNVVVKPVHPSENNINSARDITRDNYSNLASMYGANVDAPFDEFSNVTEPYSASIGNTDSPKSFSHNNLRVPDNYQCYQVVGVANYNYKARTGAKAYIKINAAGKAWQRTGLRGTGNLTDSFPSTTSVNNIEGAVPVTINTKKITSFNISVEIRCKLKDSIYAQWQQDVYNDIIRAYEQQLQAFNDAQVFDDAANVDLGNGDDDSSINRNPKFNAEIVLTELKRLCIEMLTKPFGIAQGMDFYQEGECEVPELKLSKTLDIYGSHVKFFEQAFDWNLMSKKFYPYYWAKRCDWKSLFQAQDGNDYIFQSFLQSGMGRVVVPVREGFEDAVAYYMATGEIWNGKGIVIDSDDELYLNIVDEMTSISGDPEGEEWETIVPSSLTVVQARSVLLDEEGLPCCETDQDVLDSLNLLADKNTLSLKPD